MSGVRVSIFANQSETPPAVPEQRLTRIPRRAPAAQVVKRARSKRRERSARKVVSKIANRHRRRKRRQPPRFRLGFVPMAYGYPARCDLAFLRIIPKTSIMDERYRLLARNLATLAQFEKEKKRQRPRTADRTLRVLIADLVAARTAAGMTQQQVAARMLTTASVVSRLERGLRTRPTLRTIESYAQAVGAHVEIRVRTRR